STAAKGGKAGETLVPRNLPKESEALIPGEGTVNLIPDELGVEFELTPVLMGINSGLIGSLVDPEAVTRGRTG
ncbi:MAG: hypothetical protein ACKN9K_10755, partial [Dolichospermum sp.]